MVGEGLEVDRGFEGARWPRLSLLRGGGDGLAGGVGMRGRLGGEGILREEGGFAAVWVAEENDGDCGWFVHIHGLGTGWFDR